jgi:integrase
LRQGRSEWEDNGLIFTTFLGTPLNISNLTAKRFKPALQRAGLPKTIRLYDLRHTCATLLLSAGENPKVVSERLGHVSINLTLDVYSHVLLDMQKAATDKLENILFKRTGTLSAHKTETGSFTAALNCLILLVPPQGFEPRTNRL